MEPVVITVGIDIILQQKIVELFVFLSENIVEVASFELWWEGQSASFSLYFFLEGCVKIVSDVASWVSYQNWMTLCILVMSLLLAKPYLKRL